MENHHTHPHNHKIKPFQNQLKGFAYTVFIAFQLFDFLLFDMPYAEEVTSIPLTTLLPVNINLVVFIFAKTNALS